MLPGMSMILPTALSPHPFDFPNYHVIQGETADAYHFPRYAVARRDLSQWLSEGRIQRKETVIRGGLQAAPEALLGLYKGTNTGKLLVQVKPEDASAKL